jgi:hypothetical protein
MKPALLLLFATATRLLAMAGTDQLVGEYDPIQPNPQWPKGLHAVLLDPARKVGWASWFSELPNDAQQYAFAVRTNTDAQRLIDTLAKVETRQRVVILDPGRGPRGCGNWQANAAGREWGAVLWFGNQAILAEWFKRLPVRQDGQRHFGDSVITKAPEAAPPTLTLYLGTAILDPATLKIPAGITLEIHQSSSWPGHDYEKAVEKLAALAATQKSSSKK